VLGLPDDVRGCLFDLDGVLTQTAKVHGAAWKEMFDDYLREHARQTGQPFVAWRRAGRATSGLWWEWIESGRRTR
jgi:beta-phosphoglucomutase-like phosphatase (HAD superfamily)